MQLNFILYAVYLLVLLLCLVSGAFRWHRLEGPLKLIYLAVLIVLLSEAAALFAEYHTGSNTTIYNVTDIIHATLISLYFALYFKSYILAVVLSTVSITFGIYNFYWLQAEDLVNSYFLLWSHLVVIILCLCMMVNFYKKDGSAVLGSFVHFWIALIVLLYAVTTFLNLQLFNGLMKANVDYVIVLNAFHQIVNLCVYTGITLIFYFVPKLIQ